MTYLSLNIETLSAKGIYVTMKSRLDRRTGWFRSRCQIGFQEPQIHLISVVSGQKLVTHTYIPWFILKNGLHLPSLCLKFRVFCVLLRDKPTREPHYKCRKSHCAHLPTGESSANANGSSL